MSASEHAPVAPPTDVQKFFDKHEGSVAPTTDQPQSLQVKLDRKKIIAPENRAKFWVGTTADCPIQNVTVGGFCFPRFSGTPSFSEKTGKPDRPLDLGQELELADSEVKRILDAVKSRVLRSIGSKGKRATILDVDGKYATNPHDKPLAGYLYMVPVEGLSATAREMEPTPMWSG